MNIKKLALIGGLASTMSGCVVYDDGYGVGIAPAIPAPVVAPAVVAPTPVVAPAVVVPAYRPLGWGPHYHHHYHGRWR